MAIFRIDTDGYRYTFALTTDKGAKTTVTITFSQKEGDHYATISQARMISIAMTFRLYPGTNEEGNPTMTFLAYNAKIYSITTSELSSKFGLVLKNLAPVYVHTQGYAGPKNAVVQAMSPQTTLYIHSHDPKIKPADDYYRMSGFIAAEMVENISCGALSVKKTATGITVHTQCPRKITHVEPLFRFCMFIGPSGIALVKLEEDATLNLYWFANGIDLIGFLRGDEIVQPIESNIIVIPSNGLTPFGCCTLSGEHIAISELTGMHRGYLCRHVEKLALNANRPASDLYAVESVEEVLPMDVKMVNAYVISTLSITPFDCNIIFRGWQIEMLPKIPLKFLRVSSKYITIGTHSQIFMGIIEEAYNVIDCVLSVFSQSPVLANDCDLNIYNLEPGKVIPFFTHLRKFFRVLSNGRVVPYAIDNIPFNQSTGIFNVERDHLICSSSDKAIKHVKFPAGDFASEYQEPGRSTMAYACCNGQVIEVSALYKHDTGYGRTTITARHGGHRLRLNVAYGVDIRLFGNYVIAYTAGYRVSVWKLTPNFANFMDIINSLVSCDPKPDFTFAGAQVSISSHLLFTCPIASNSQHFRLNLNDDAPEVKMFADIKIMNIFKEFNIDPNDVYYYLTANNAVLNIATTETIHTSSVKIPGHPYYMSAFRL